MSLVKIVYRSLPVADPEISKWGRGHRKRLRTLEGPRGKPSENAAFCQDNTFIFSCFGHISVTRSSGNSTSYDHHKLS